jgi:hypothetical protein
MSVSTLPATLQVDGVVLAYAIGSVELAVALSVIGAAPIMAFGSAANVMVWLLRTTLNVRLTVGAGAYVVALPDWSALMMHCPIASRLTVFPVTLQTLVAPDVKLTASPDDAVALTAKFPLPIVRWAGVAKVIV